MKKYIVEVELNRYYYLYEDNTVYAQKKEDRDLKFVSLIVINNENGKYTDEEILQMISVSLPNRSEGVFRFA